MGLFSLCNAKFCELIDTRRDRAARGAGRHYNMENSYVGHNLGYPYPRTDRSIEDVKCTTILISYRRWKNKDFYNGKKIVLEISELNT